MDESDNDNTINMMNNSNSNNSNNSGNIINIIDNTLPKKNKDMDSDSSNDILCRICYRKIDLKETHDDVLAPCNCSGSIKYMHDECFNKWYHEKNKSKCEICLFNFPIMTITDPTTNTISNQEPGMYNRRQMNRMLWEATIQRRLYFYISLILLTASIIPSVFVIWIITKD